jgi:hypothetical protein
MTDFYDYVLSFYGPDGIYPTGYTLKQIKRATSTHLQILKIKNEKFVGDSIDRECVLSLLNSKIK